MKIIDRILNAITMYRVVAYGLGILAGLSLVFALFDRLSFTPTNLVLSFLILFTTAYVTDYIFGRIWRVPTNNVSWPITALILFLILQPGSSLASFLALGLAAFISSASKFLIAKNGKHIFNPAAFAAAFVSLLALQPTTWWVGSTTLWPFALLVGLAVVRKIRRFPMVLAFVAVSVILQFVLFALDQRPLASSMQNALISSPLIFLATIMLTEPATMPPRRTQQIIFAVGIAVLYVTAWKVGPIYIYPEVALLLGNLYAYAVSPKFRLRLELKEIQQVSDRVYNYVFRPDRKLAFLPGQYMEWTLAGVPYDNRGNRRTLTIASSPTEQDIHVGIKYYQPSSTYKATFHQLQPGDTVFAGQLAGDFTLTGNEHRKLVFVAGGIGVTPFRSMVKYLTDTGRQADVILLYVVSDPHEFAYLREFQAAAANGVRLVPIVTRTGYEQGGLITARLSRELIAGLVPDYAERMFYISGPDVLVDAAKGYLRELEVARHNIKTDHFSGY